MKKIAAKLMDFGMDYHYENRCSDGEKITCYDLGLEVSSYNGRIYYSCASPTEDFPDNEASYDYLVSKIEEECINETT